MGLFDKMFGRGGSEPQGNESLKNHIQRVLEKAEPSMLPQEISQLSDEIESSMAAFAAQLKRDAANEKANEDLKRRRQETLEKSVGIAFSSMRDRAAKQPASMRAEVRLRSNMREVLESASIGLNDNEKEKIEDRMIHLLESYTRTPDEAKADVYERGEQEVLSVIDPPARPRTATASGNA